MEKHALAARIKKLTTSLSQLKESKSQEAAGKDFAIQKGNIMSTSRSHSSDEARALSMFGAKHVSDLLKVNTQHPRFARVPEELKHLVTQLKEATDVNRYIAQMFDGGSRDRVGRDIEGADVIAKIKGISDTYYAKQELAPRLKAFGSSGDAEWIQTAVSQNYIEEYQIAPSVEGALSSVNMPSNPYKMPVQGSLGKAALIAENTAQSDSVFSTDALTLSAQKFGVYHILPDEISADSAPDLLAAARQHVIIAQARAIESAILNGDSDGTHIDSDTQAGASSLAEKAWDGLRKVALGNSANGGTVTFSNAAITDAAMRSLRSALKKFGSNPNELLIIVGPVAYQQLLSTTNVSTMEKFGPQATILTGSLSKYAGVPVLVSEHMREDLNASGVYDGTTVNRAGIIMLNTKRFWLGIRRPIVVSAMNDLPSQDRFLLASYQRKAFAVMPQSATETSVVYGYNIAV